MRCVENHAVESENAYGLVLVFMIWRLCGIYCGDCWKIICFFLYVASFKFDITRWSLGVSLWKNDWFFCSKDCFVLSGKVYYGLILSMSHFHCEQPCCWAYCFFHLAADDFWFLCMRWVKLWLLYKTNQIC